MVEQPKATSVKPKSASTKAQTKNPADLALEQQIEKERENNDRLALEIEKLKAERFGWNRDIVKNIQFAPYLQELQRQKEQSDKQLASLRRPRAATDTTATSSRPKREVTGRDPEGNVARRRKLVRNNPWASAAELCQIFHDAKLPVLASFADKSWPELYKTRGYKGKIDPLIAKDRRWIRGHS